MILLVILHYILGLDELSRLFEDHLYLMLFWTHFIAINLFLGGWIVKDSQKFYINKILISDSLNNYLFNWTNWFILLLDH